MRATFSAVKKKTKNVNASVQLFSLIKNRIDLFGSGERDTGLCVTVARKILHLKIIKYFLTETPQTFVDCHKNKLNWKSLEVVIDDFPWTRCARAKHFFFLQKFTRFVQFELFNLLFYCFFLFFWSTNGSTRMWSFNEFEIYYILKIELSKMQ